MCDSHSSISFKIKILIKDNQVLTINIIQTIHFILV